MTETLKTLLCGAKDVDEAYAILCAHPDDITTEDQRKMYEMVTGKTELTEEELDMIVGGSWFSEAWTSVKSWVSEHKVALIIAACALAGAALGMAVGVAGCAIATATGTAFTTGELVATIGVTTIAGAFIGGGEAAVALKDEIYPEDETSQ